MKSSMGMAVAVAVCLLAWMLSGVLTAQAPKLPEKKREQKNIPRIKVQTHLLYAQPVTREVLVQGQLEALRRVDIRAETEGRVKQVLVEKGQRVAADEVLLQLRMDTRQVALREARALLEQRQKELDSLQTLKQQGLQAENKLFAARTALAAATAAAAQIELDIAHTHIRAAFAGVINQRPLELGDFVQRGEVVAELIDDTGLKIVGQVPQQSIAQVKIGQIAQATLLDGTQLEGKVSYISALADANTRSFRVEVQAPNPQQLRSGTSVTLRIPVETRDGHFVSPAVLTLNDGGELGVKAVDESSRVVFYPIEILRTQIEGAWIVGLPSQTQLISLGQNFVKDGEWVEAVLQESNSVE